MPFNPARDLQAHSELLATFNLGPPAWILFVNQCAQLKAADKKFRDVDWLASAVFYLHHPERRLPGGDYLPIQSGQVHSQAEWKNFKKLIRPIVPALATAVDVDFDTRDYPVTLFVLQHYVDQNGEWPHSSTIGQTWNGGSVLNPLEDLHDGIGRRWIRITTVQDFVRTVSVYCGARGYIKTLRIGGHGTAASFRLGNVVVSLANVNSIGQQISSVLGYFKPGKSLIYLDHCDVGQSQALLKKVSEIFGGVAVIGPLGSQYTNRQSGPKFEGPATICGPGGCTSVATPNMEPGNLLELLYRFGDLPPQ